MKRRILACLLAAVAVAGGRTTRADVFHMPEGTTSLEFVIVGNPGNTPDTLINWPDATTGYGAVSSPYRIGKFEITTAQYAAFLSAVATASDPYGLYNPDMAEDYGGIVRTESGGANVYEVKTGWENRPINYISWGDAVRFVNWLHHGQPEAPEEYLDWITETGAYTLNGAVTWQTLMEVVRNDDARYWLPSEDEWYKAAYYDPTRNDGDGGYWLYPTVSDAIAPPMANYGSTVNTTTDVGAYEYPSYYGTFDQGGNVAEWNEGKTSIYARSFRGGSFWGYYGDLDVRASYRPSYVNPSTDYYDVGFRVATVVPEPGGIALLVCGAAAALIWRKRRR